MKASPLPLLLALVLAPLAPGCGGGQSCTLLGCSDGVGVTLPVFAAAHAMSLPLTLSVCLGSECSTFQIDATGVAPVCYVKSAGNVLCTIDGQGTVVLKSIPLPAGTADGAMVPVHVTATDKTGTKVADGTQTVTIATLQPNGPTCDPTCHSAEVTISL